MPTEIGNAVKRLVSEIIVIGLASIVVIAALHEWDAVRARKAQGAMLAARRQPAITGDRIGLAKVDFSKSSLSIILLSSPTCPYCKASLGFHSKLLAQARQTKTPMYVVLPSQYDATKYEKALGVDGQQLRNWEDLSLGLTGTPTLLAVDNSGIIRATWIGLLDPKAQDEVMQAISSHSIPTVAKDPHDGVRNLSESELAVLQSGGAATILDVHERDYPLLSRQGEMSIPLMELPYRDTYELDKRKTQVVDCTALEEKLCTAAVSTLMKAGFQAATIHLGVYENYCAATHVVG